ncbi:MAG: Rpn family recombination-promoting nuclease/putative transposase [Chitinophagaceae bacterium]|jgi:predicted transposase/invertase (TIGR01784 family)|nr:Rpn family recombination-promoting nuclease/putative transposase [Chitinophagaceae bacterium]
MAHYLDPKNDLTFKRVFGEHKHLCMSLINSMLLLEKPVVNIEYQTNELVPEIPALRNSIVDVRCTDSDHRQFIVEMQLYWSEMFKSRVLLNASKAYVRQLDRAKSFELLQPVYALNFVNEIFEHSPEMKDEYYHYYKIVNIKDTEKQIKGLEFLFIELPKFKPANRAEKKLQELWMRFLTEINENTKQVSKELLDNEFTREAVEYMKVSAYTKEQLEAYDKWKIDMMTERGLLGSAKNEGIREGMEKGRIEGKIEIAKQAKAMKMPVADIAKLTGLSQEEINKL